MIVISHPPGSNMTLTVQGMGANGRGNANRYRFGESFSSIIIKMHEEMFEAG